VPAELPDFDLYGILEVDPRASSEVITASWKTLQKKYYPRARGQGDEERAVRLNVAYEWLSDPVLRARYDRSRSSSPPSAQPRTRATPPPPAVPTRPTAGPGYGRPGPSAGRGYASVPPARRTASRGPSEGYLAGLAAGFMVYVLRAARWQRIAVALLAATLAPWLLSGLQLGTGRLDATAFVLLALATPVAVLAVAWATKGFETQRMRTAGAWLQTAIVGVEGLGIVSAAWLVIGGRSSSGLGDAASVVVAGLAALAVGGAFMAMIRRTAP
jgi:hypothetical protein